MKTLTQFIKSKVIGKSGYPVIVEEIHADFDTASEKLLQESRRILQNDTDKSKGEALSRLGFTATPEASAAREAERAKAQATENAELIEHYRQKYPFNKFITRADVERICKKYSLVCGGVNLYKGFVPADKVKQMEGFKVQESDLPSYLDHLMHTNREHLLWAMYSRKEQGKYRSMPHNPGFQICAPAKDMNTEGKMLSGAFLVNLPDPVVLQPVKGGYLIVTAWGDEAADPIVVNPIQN